MICKKCGNIIEDNSKFCSVCGEKVEELVQEQNIQPESVIEEVPMVVSSIQPESEPLEQTVIVAPVISNTNVNENLMQKTTEVNDATVVTKEQKKKNNVWIFVVLGVLLGIVALTLVYFTYSKTNNNSIKVLEKALENITHKAENSGTIDAKLLIQSNTEEVMNLSATIKYAKQGDDNYNFNLTLNKSIFFDEINLYASILDDKATLFINSSVIDMLGLTSSTPSMWVHMTTTEQEIEEQTGTETDKLKDIDFSNILDEKHFKLIGEQNGLKHYQLVINNDLVNKIELEASKEEDLKEFAESLSELTETYYVDFYINNSNELVKISMDLTSYLDDESIRSAVISFELNNLGATTVQIPAEAKNSAIDLETYITRYAMAYESYDDTTDDAELTLDYIY